MLGTEHAMDSAFQRRILLFVPDESKMF